MCPLRNPIREYAWGSRNAIAELLGQPIPAPRPQAEIWMGDHPSDPSRARCRGDWILLPDLLRESPAEILGESAAARFDGELPFLFKVLAAARPLSIQAHPNREQAREGFERENAAGIALAARERNYPDPHPKSELICALSPFSALCGFRPIAEIARVFRELQVEAFETEVDALERDADAAALGRFFSAVWNARGDRLTRAIDQAVKRAERRSDDPAARWMTALAALYPGDAGVLAPLFLNLVALAPGEGMYLGAGQLHSYLEGVGIEIMGNSDNVLRGGLTTKHVDVPELCQVLRFEPGEPEVLLPREASPGERVFKTPSDEFELAVLQVRAGTPWQSARSRGVEILLSVAGDVTVADRTAGESFKLEHGASVLIPDSVDRYELAGEGVVYRAGMPKR
ncbi:MAG: mannose-6-phosphate isomerase, class I [Deltaproteobacteria bacterium]|nr:mannose-6-phosphate isomerase, class I [Deltaproteobacteria bacterium]